ncbi:MarR family winged helix-turn-helix transcriptional regulator [Paenibacillus arenilitoris]|uniref:MarR family transcriptional regulator n=1 Tax=Paenibacillus arenilitoris TaxID=2772299 RepID=A0A927CJQ6_9BACL|nr:MarR family transcriptional regulator [Paenibacillus arenilitoris]MBD2869353.1 MarR family transcriptional regulator [Paenibacillus arenilitoris]
MENKSNSPIHSNRASRSIGRLIMELRRLERQPRSFGQAGMLTPSEIHTVEAIGCGDGVLMSELAARLGVTKGAVTQLVARLEAKELAARSPHPHDSRATVISLTDSGKEAYQAHEEAHDRFYERLRAKLSEREIEIFERGIDQLIESLKEK